MSLMRGSVRSVSPIGAAASHGAEDVEIIPRAAAQCSCMITCTVCLVCRGARISSRDGDAGAKSSWASKLPLPGRYSKLRLCN